MTRNSLLIFYMVFFAFITSHAQTQTQVHQGFNPQEATDIEILNRHISGHPERLRALLQQDRYKQYINIPDQQGRIPLNRAVINYNIMAVEILLSAGANPNLSGKGGLVPLYLSRDPLITQKLIDRGARVNPEKIGIVSPLFFHLRNEILIPENIHVLLEAGARTDITSRRKGTALHFLLKPESTYHESGLPPLSEEDLNERRYQIAKDLIDHDLDVNATTKDGFTALHFAARGGFIKIIRLLFDHDADINATTRYYNFTPMMYALGAGALDAVETLLNLGAKFDIQNFRGHTVESTLRMNLRQDPRFPKLVRIIDKRKRTSPVCSEPLIETDSQPNGELSI